MPSRRRSSAPTWHADGITRRTTGFSRAARGIPTRWGDRLRRRDGSDPLRASSEIQGAPPDRPSLRRDRDPPGLLVVGTALSEAGGRSAPQPVHVSPTTEIAWL